MLVRLSLPDSEIGAISSPPTLSRANHATFSDLVLPCAGKWRLEVVVQFDAEQVRFSGPVEVR